MTMWDLGVRIALFLVPAAVVSVLGVIMALLADGTPRQQVLGGVVLLLWGIFAGAWWTLLVVGVIP